MITMTTTTPMMTPTTLPMTKRLKPTLVGSRALEYWLPTFTCSPNSDWDVWCYPSEENSLKSGLQRVETSSWEHLESHELYDYIVDEGERNPIVNGVECNVLGLEGLALVKRSHLWRAHCFEKHITMYHKHLAKFAKWDDPSWVELLNYRTRLTRQTYPQRNPSLKQTNEEFFDDAVKKKFDHDWLHELVANYERPLYERLKQEEGIDSAWCEKDLWLSLSHQDKCLCVAEEAHVIACERFMIPKDWEYASKLAYFQAVNKVCTTLTSGWFRDFAIDNFLTIIGLYDENKFKKVRKETT